MYDLVVIGGGPGGYVAAIRAAQLGQRVALVEGHAVGGTCLNVGCIPSKAMIQAAEVFRTVREAARFGIETGQVRLNFAAVAERQAQVVARLTQGVQSLLRANKVEIVPGWGSIPTLGAVRVARTDGTVVDLRAANTLVATGSRPALPPVPGVNRPGVVTSDSFWSIRTLPARTVVIGGGVVGIELAAMLAALSSQVTVVEMLPAILAQADQELVRLVGRQMEAGGIKVLVNTRVTEVSGGPETANLVRLEDPQGRVDLPADLVVVATGRIPNVDRLQLDRLGVAYSRAGIQVTDHFATTVPGIYAIGDVIGAGLAHVASAQGHACVSWMFGEEAHFNPAAIPNVVYTHPELAWVGLTEEQARSAGNDYVVSRFPLAALGRAHTLGDTNGLVKMIAARDGRVLGIHWLSPHAGELIGEGALALTLHATARQLAGTIHPHPTLSEALGEAAHGLLGGAIHVVPRR